MKRQLESWTNVRYLLSSTVARRVDGRAGNTVRIQINQRYTSEDKRFMVNSKSHLNSSQGLLQRANEPTLRATSEQQSPIIPHLAGDCLMFVYFARVRRLDLRVRACVRAYVCDALSKGHSMCARAKRNHHIIHPIPVATSTRLFFSSSSSSSFSSRSFVTLSSSLLDQTHALFSPSSRTHTHHPYVRPYSRCVQAASFEQNKTRPLGCFFSPSLSLALSHIGNRTADDGEKIAAGREKRTRLSILRNDNVWARVYVCSSERSVFIIDIICYDARCTHTLLFSCFYSKIHSLAFAARCRRPREREKRRTGRNSLKLMTTPTLGMKDDQEMNMQSFVFFFFSFQSSFFVSRQSTDSLRKAIAFYRSVTIH